MRVALFIAGLFVVWASWKQRDVPGSFYHFLAGCLLIVAAVTYEAP